MAWKLIMACLVAGAGLIGDASAAKQKWLPLQCSACEALAREIARKIDDGREDKTSVLKSHRLGKNNKQGRVNYATSELRAIEILEEVCDEVGRYNWRQSTTNHTRFFTKEWSDTKSVEHYDKKEKDLFKDADKQLKWNCNKWVDDFHDDFVESIKKAETYEEIAGSVCNTTLMLCRAEKLEPFREKELDRRKKWLKKEEAKKAKREAKKKEEEEKRAKEEEERKAKEAEEEALRASEAGATGEGAPAPEAASGEAPAQGGEGNPSEGTAKEDGAEAGAEAPAAEAGAGAEEAPKPAQEQEGMGADEL